MRVPIHQLKAGLSRYIAKARAGEVIEVTSHDKPVARIVGIPTTGRAGVARLLARGAAQWGGSKPSFQPPLTLGATGKSLSEMVLEAQRRFVADWPHYLTLDLTQELVTLAGDYAETFALRA